MVAVISAVYLVYAVTGFKKGGTQSKGTWGPKHTLSTLLISYQLGAQQYCYNWNSFLSHRSYKRTQEEYQKEVVNTHTSRSVKSCALRGQQ